MQTIKLSKFVSELELIKAKTPKVINYDKICYLIDHANGILNRYGNNKGDLDIPVETLAEVIKNSKRS
jgi:hypothetical protein